jgi:hypothetical protein
MFKDEYAFLSNFYQCKVYYRSMPFPTVEHAYQASKTLNFKTINLISNLKPNEAWKAKRIGGNPKFTTIREDFDDLKLIIMEPLLVQKFHYESLKDRLLQTGDQQLVEGNYWHDNYWGECFCRKCKNKTGENNLGKLIMKIRSDL